MNKQEISFDGKELIIKTNNGVIRKDFCTTNIAGEFTANADTVAFLLSAINNQSLKLSGYHPNTKWLLSEDISKVIKNYTENYCVDIEYLKKDLANYKKSLAMAEETITKLKNKIDKHNSRNCLFFKKIK